MKKYYVNTKAQANGDHEVHVEGCQYMPNSENSRYLGEFFGCEGAIRAAKFYYSTTNGCYYCCNACHTG